MSVAATGVGPKSGPRRGWRNAGTWAGAIIVGIDHGEFGAILAAIAHELAARSQVDWIDLTLFVARAK